MAGPEELLDPMRFREFYDRVLPMIYGYLWRRSGRSEETAMELTQDTFLGAVKSLRSGQTVVDPLAWVMSLARRRLVDFYPAAGGPWNEFYEWPEPESTGPEIFIAEGTYQGSTVGWEMLAFHTSAGDLCIRLSGLGCVGDIHSGEHLGALLTSSSFEAGQDARWCAFGTVRDAASVQLRLSDGTQTAAPIFTNPDFAVDFYVFCGLGDQPASEVTALDSNGNIIDVIPDTTRN